MNVLGTVVESEKRQFIVITLGGEQYGIDIQYIDNIVRMQKVTRVPKSERHYKGVINLRGAIIPVMSARLKMGLPKDELTKGTRIIIVKIESSEPMGIMVDEVKEVVTLSEEQIERVSYDSKEERANFIFGIGKDKSGLISLMDLSLVLAE